MNKFSVVHKPILRLEGEDKVRGQTRYAEDIKLFNEAIGRTLYSKYPRAKIRSIHTEKAESLPGVLKVITADDVPGSNCLFGRFPVLASGEAKYIGDAIACVAAEDRETAEKALGLIEVEYEPLPGIFSLEEAMDTSFSPVHPDRPDNTMENTFYPMYVGQADDVLAQADQTLLEEYSTPFAVNGYIEPDSIVVDRDSITGGIVVFGCIQNVFSIRAAVCDALGLPATKVRVVQSAIGGSFGGKNESSVALATRAALLSTLTGRAVRMSFSRKEVFLSGVKRHPYRMRIESALSPEGIITAWKHTISVLGGPYNNQSMFANWRASVHSAGPYKIPSVKTRVQAYYSNTPYGGAFRGFSAPQVCFAVESMIDELALKACMDPAEFRRKNFVRPGDSITCGQVVDPDVMVLPLEEMLDDVLLRSQYDSKKEEFSRFNLENQRFKKGLGFAATYRGCGLGGEGYDVAGAEITIEKDGSIQIHSDMVEMGQGLRTAHAQVAAEVLGVSLERIGMMETDTSSILDAGPTVASRGLSAGGMAVKICAEKLLKRMVSAFAEHWSTPVDSIQIKDDRIFTADKQKDLPFGEAASFLINQRGIGLSAQGWFNPGIVNIDPETGTGNCYPSYLSGISLTEVLVDLYTGQVKVPRITMAYELGRAVNPDIVRGQIIGGYTQGLGYALSENFITEKGYVKTTSFGSYLMPGIADVPEFDLKLFEEDFHTGPYGAKGVGEVGVEMAAPGVANAVFNATGVRVRSLPLSHEKLAPLFLEQERK
jgi:CO/xanthine dehydrogenase Mo-binding subunit